VSNRRLRLVHVIMNMNYGGMERILNNLIRLVPQSEFEVHLVLLDYIGRFGAGLEGFATLHQAGKMSSFSLLRPVELTKLLRNLKADVVHSHSGVWLKSARAARAAGVAGVVHTEHGRPLPDPLVGRWADWIASRSTDVVVAVSQPLARVLRRVVKNGTRVEVILNGVDPDRFAPAHSRGEARQRLGLRMDDLVIGSIGRLEPIKNHDLALRALARFRAESPGKRSPVLVLAGDGSERARLEARVKALGLGDVVRFLGWRDDIEMLLSAFDLYTMTSDSEGTSISLLEAMSSGLCAVVTDVGGNAAVLGPELRHQLVTAGDDQALAKSWRRFLEQPSLRQERGELARARVLRDFSVHRTAAEYAALYRELVARRPV
jgi:glycosyltransferase involved in cell wall biosynthesis